ncbi:MAG: hypothetical protein IJI16_03450 [Atopobiaceae bacterium]|nr:hypothetical protein [Atopobiaceae bacterium]
MSRRLAKRSLALFVTVALSFGLALGLVGCGHGDEDAIRAQVSAEFDRIRDTSEGNVRSQLGDEAFQSIQDKGIDPVAVYSSLFGGLQYEVTDVSVEKDVAQVTLTLTSVDIQAVVNGYKQAVSDWAASDDATYTFDQSGQEGLESEVIRMLGEALTASDLPTTTREVTIEMRRGDDGTWAPADGSQVAGLLLGGTSLESLLA